MKHIVCFSGGKDSTALILWAKENLPEFTTIFCDTKWEKDGTLAYVGYVNRTLLDGKLITLTSAEYPNGMRELVQIKGMIPQNSGRFCTSELKVEPTRAYLLTLDDEYCLYDGKRKDESTERSDLPSSEWADYYDCEIHHPIRNWSAAQCFALMAKHGVDPNPLYLMGAGRVGCFPCININLRELKALSFSAPEIRDRIRELEALAGRSFFKPKFIPHRFQTGFDNQSGKHFPTAEDVFRYIDSVDEDQLPMFEPRSCMSVYNLCE